MARPRLQCLGQNTSATALFRRHTHRVFIPTVSDAAAAFACRSATVQLSAPRHFRMNGSAPSSTHQHHLPAFYAAFRRPSDFMPISVISSSKCTIQQFSCPPEWSSPPTSYLNITLCGRRCSPIRATHLAKNILLLRTDALMLSESVLVSASAYERLWLSRFRFRRPRHCRSMTW